jgi:hypothetical protein
MSLPMRRKIVSHGEILTPAVRWILLVVLSVGGCSFRSTKDTEPVADFIAGHVTVAGQPLTTGSVLLDKTDHSVATLVPINTDGSFTAKTLDGTGLPIGEYRIAIAPLKIGETDQSQLSAFNNNPDAAPLKSAIPERYQKISTSGLTLVVVEGKNPPLTLELKP